jgi:hypothetical protein
MSVLFFIDPQTLQTSRQVQKRQQRGEAHAAPSRQRRSFWTLNGGVGRTSRSVPPSLSRRDRPNDHHSRNSPQVSFRVNLLGQLLGSKHRFDKDWYSETGVSE